MKRSKLNVLLSDIPKVHSRRLYILKYLYHNQFVTCMTLGGSNGSHHSNDLTVMCKRGLVKRKRYLCGISSGHWRYQRTKKGTALIEKWR